MAKTKVPKVDVPRSTPEINQEFTEICTRLGYMEAEIYERETVIQTMKEKILELGKEGALRRDLDAAAEKTQKETKDEPVQA